MTWLTDKLEHADCAAVKRPRSAAAPAAPVTAAPARRVDSQHAPPVFLSMQQQPAAVPGAPSRHTSSRDLRHPLLGATDRQLPATAAATCADGCAPAAARLAAEAGGAPAAASGADKPANANSVGASAAAAAVPPIHANVDAAVAALPADANPGILSAAARAAVVLSTPRRRPQPPAPPQSTFKACWRGYVLQLPIRAVRFLYDEVTQSVARERLVDVVVYGRPADDGAAFTADGGAGGRNFRPPLLVCRDAQLRLSRSGGRVTRLTWLMRDLGVTDGSRLRVEWDAELGAPLLVPIPEHAEAPHQPHPLPPPLAAPTAAQPQPLHPVLPPPAAAQPQPRVAVAPQAQPAGTPEQQPPPPSAASQDFAALDSTPPDSPWASECGAVQPPSPLQHQGHEWQQEAQQQPHELAQEWQSVEKLGALGPGRLWGWRLSQLFQQGHHNQQHLPPLQPLGGPPAAAMVKSEEDESARLPMMGTTLAAGAATGAPDAVAPEEEDAEPGATAEVTSSASGDSPPWAGGGEEEAEGRWQLGAAGASVAGEPGSCTEAAEQNDEEEAGAGTLLPLQRQEPPPLLPQVVVAVAAAAEQERGEVLRPPGREQGQQQAVRAAGGAAGRGDVQAAEARKEEVEEEEAAAVEGEWPLGGGETAGEQYESNGHDSDYFDSSISGSCSDEDEGGSEDDEGYGEDDSSDAGHEDGDGEGDDMATGSCLSDSDQSDQLGPEESSEEEEEEDEDEGEMDTEGLGGPQESEEDEEDDSEEDGEDEQAGGVWADMQRQQQEEEQASPNSEEEEEEEEELPPLPAGGGDAREDEAEAAAAAVAPRCIGGRLTTSGGGGRSDPPHPPLRPSAPAAAAAAAEAAADQAATIAAAAAAVVSVDGATPSNSGGASFASMDEHPSIGVPLGAPGHLPGAAGCPYKRPSDDVLMAPAVAPVVVDGRPTKRPCTGACGAGGGAAAAAERPATTAAPPPAGPAPSLRRLHGCVPLPSHLADGGGGGGGGAVQGLPPLRPGELRLCGLTFHPDLAPAVRSAMATWQAALGDSLANADPAAVQITLSPGPPACGAAATGGAAAPLSWRSTFDEHRLSANVICSLLARYLGLMSEDCDWDAPLPEGPLELTAGVAPAPAAQLSGGAGLVATAPLRRNAVLGVVGGYVMPAVVASRFACRGFRDCAGEVVSELRRRAAAADLAVAWQFVAGSFRMPYPTLELTPEGAAGPAPLELNMLGYGNLAALINDPRVKPQSWLPDNDVDAPPPPNCMVIPVSVRGLVLPVLVALRDIAPGEPLLRDYGPQWWREQGRAWEVLEFDGVSPQQLLHSGSPPLHPLPQQQQPMLQPMLQGWAQEERQARQQRQCPGQLAAAPACAAPARAAVAGAPPLSVQPRRGPARSAVASTDAPAVAAAAVHGNGGPWAQTADAAAPVAGIAAAAAAERREMNGAPAPAASAESLRSGGVGDAHEHTSPAPGARRGVSDGGGVPGPAGGAGLDASEAATAATVAAATRPGRSMGPDAAVCGCPRDAAATSRKRCRDGAEEGARRPSHCGARAAHGSPVAAAAAAAAGGASP